MWNGSRPDALADWLGAIAEFRKAAQAAWPNEAVGLITTEGSLVLCDNVSPEPDKAFEACQDTVDEIVHAGRLAAVLHSHPSTIGAKDTEVEGNAYPSAADMEHQIASAVPWGIVLAMRGGASEPFWFGDQIPRMPLVGRSFRHGVTDCYSLVRDWHLEAAGIRIPEFPRDNAWWDTGKTLYDQFDKAGFRRVQRDLSTLAPGDCFITSVRSPVPNHAGIYIGGGEILHQLWGHLSMREGAHKWASRLNFIVRHADLPDDFATPEPSRV